MQIERVARRAEATASAKRRKTVTKVPAEERKILRKTSGDTLPDAGGHAFAGEGDEETAAAEVMHTRCICEGQGQMEEYLKLHCAKIYDDPQDDTCAQGR